MSAWEKCTACGGHGLRGGMDGPEDCYGCGGEGVVRARDERGRFVAISALAEGDG